MQEKDLHFYKLNSIAILKESIYLYKENYRIFLKISFLSLLISLFNTTSSYIKEVLGWGIILTLALFIISIPLLYLELKLTVTLIICIEKSYYNKPISIKKAFQMSEESIWSYIGASLLFGLMVLPFALIGVGLFFFIKLAVIKWSLILTLLIPIEYLTTIYGFAPASTVVETERTNYFQHSKKLVKGNFWRILILLTVVALITSLPGLFITDLNPWFKALSALNQYVIQIIHSILMVFISPLASIVTIILYLTLRKKNIYRQ